MLIVDLIVALLIALTVGWGFRRGLTVNTLALGGFAAGAVLGSRLGPLVLNGGLRSAYAPALALPGALLVGAVAAALVERFGFRVRHRLDRLGPGSPIAGALLGGCLGVVGAWILGTAVLQLGSLGDQVRRSAILSRLNAVLPPPGPVPTVQVASADSFPTLQGRVPLPGAAVDPQVTSAPAVRAASRSVLRVVVQYCNQSKGGTGWIAANGIVATNAHVVAAEDLISVRFRDRGPPYSATPIWFDPKNDIALLRVPGVKGVPALPLGDPTSGSSAAIIGFPGGNWEIRPTRLGPTSNTFEGFLGGHPLPREFSTKLFGRSITPFAGRSEPGNSGSPLVDDRGRVLATVFGGGGYTGLGVPNAFLRVALRRAGPAVGTGPCQ